MLLTLGVRARGIWLTCALVVSCFFLGTMHEHILDVRPDNVLPFGR